MPHRSRCMLTLSMGLLALLGRVVLAAESTAAHVTVYFSPHGGATEAVVREINAATQQILVQAYSFTSTPIDKANETDKYSAATFLVNAGIQTLIDDQHAIAHSKVMVIDSATVITGSFNFTKAAEEKNAENLLVIKDAPELVKVYEANIQAHAAHAHAYRRGVAIPASTLAPAVPTNGEVRG